MKAVDQYIQMVMFLLLLKIVNLFLQMKPKSVTTQVKALDECILIVLFVLLLKSLILLRFAKFIWTREHGGHLPESSISTVSAKKMNLQFVMLTLECKGNLYVFWL